MGIRLRSTSQQMTHPISPVILSEAKDLCGRKEDKQVPRFFASLRMTARGTRTELSRTSTYANVRPSGPSCA